MFELDKTNGDQSIFAQSEACMISPAARTATDEPRAVTCAELCIGEERYEKADGPARAGAARIHRSRRKWDASRTGRSARLRGARERSREWNRRRARNQIGEQCHCAGG